MNRNECVVFQKGLLNQMNMLTVEPIGGLGNRMRVIDSGRVLAKQLGLPLYLNWVLDPSCNCSFHELFEIPHGVVVHEVSLNRLHKRLLHRTLPFRVMLTGGRYIGMHSDEKVLSHTNLTNFCADLKGHLYLTTCFEFMSGDLPRLVPTKVLQQKISTLTEGFCANVVGVHIRRKDNSTSILKSPTSAFVTRMREELERNRNIKFFLATDSLDEEKELQLLFPGKIIVHRKISLNRNEPDAIKDAAIDMYCLAKTVKIVGSHWSSFSAVAAYLGSSELIIASDIYK